MLLVIAVAFVALCWALETLDKRLNHRFDTLEDKLDKISQERR